MADIYRYSLIRAVPDRRRGEWVNIGLVVYLDDRLDVRLLQNLTKLKVLAPSLDVRSIDDLPEIWASWTAKVTEVAQRHLLLAQFPLFQASEVASFACAPRDYDATVDLIMKDLVVPAPAPRHRDSLTRIEQRLRGYFARSKLLGTSQEDIDRHLVVHRYPIAPGEHLYADFALRNGNLRLTETIDFRAGVDTLRNAKRGQAALKAITLDRAMTIYKGNCIPSVVYEANEETLDLIQPSLNLLTSYCDRLYDAGNDVDLADYMSMMADAANAQLSGLANNIRPNARGS
jgi:hypothetical protein